MASSSRQRALNGSVEGLNLIPSPDDVANSQDLQDLGIFSSADFPDLSGTGFIDQSIEHSLDYQPDYALADASAWNPLQTLPSPTSPISLDLNDDFASPADHFNFAINPLLQTDPQHTASSLTPSTPSVTGSKAPEEKARVAAEEDKRRRNTAASARFRVKKKEREQALEKSAKEMSDKVTALETRIETLETENGWLRELVVQVHGKVDMPEKLHSVRRQSEDENIDERIDSESKHGVGTTKRLKTNGPV